MIGRMIKGCKELWLISEHGDDARDNGFVFFQYMCKKHPEIKCVFVADKKNLQDWNKVRKIGSVVQYKSVYHKLLFIVADKIITSHVGDSEPWDYDDVVSFRKKHPKLWGNKKIVFLDHGVIDKNISKTYHKKRRPVDLFVCTTIAEKNYIKSSLGYQEKELAFTGLPRYDGLFKHREKRQILLIPTWRTEFDLRNCLSEETMKRKFLNSEYYRCYSQLLNSSKIIELLKTYDYELVFYPHYEMQNYLRFFDISNNRVVILDKFSGNVQKLLKESALMITDYSSVAFDFAYMNKPIIYYQFDSNSKKHYGESYFSYQDDGFGPVSYTEEQVLEEMECFLNGGCKNIELYTHRAKKTFAYHDRKHCDRVYHKIRSLI